MKRIARILRLNDDALSVENKTFIIACFIIVIGNFLAFTANFFLGLSWKLNLLLFGSTLVYAVFLYFAIKTKVTDQVRFYFLLLGFIFIIPGWYMNAGSDGSTPIYVVFYICAGLLSLPGRWHLAFVCILLSLYACLIVSEYYLPQYIIHYTNESVRHNDFITAAFLVSILVIILIIFFKTIYESDLKKLALSKRVIEDAQEELMQAKLDAINATEVKSNFLASMSHEIRTPLHGIIGTAELMKQTPLNTDQREYLRILEASSYILSNIINDILDLSKIEADQVKLFPKPCNLKDCVQNIIKISSPQIAAFNKKIKLGYTIPETIETNVIADEGRLSQVLLNLVNNAIKFTHEGNINISLTATALTGHNQLVTFSISDTGIGISKANMEKLFLPFSQIYNADTRKYGGTGLGLSICKKLTELMDGKIWVESEEGKGSSFKFSIPFPIAEKAVEKELPAIVKTETFLPAGALSILLAEDNKMNQFLLNKMFSHIGYTIEFAENGNEAVAKSTQKFYDLIFMDIQMPEMDGYAATETILSHHQALQKKQPVIIAMTASAMKEDREEGLRAGMKDFVTKPVTIPQLKSLISKWTIAQ